MDAKSKIVALLNEISTESSPKIGIAFTEYNRYDIFRKSYDETLKRLPPNCELVVVDDGSKKPVPEATYRFENNQGICVAKNKCLELLYLRGCEHIFLFDSDFYPLVDNWWKPYIESKEPHLMYIFKEFAAKTNRKVGDTSEVYRNSEIIAYNHPRGCMLYIERKCLDIVGGMDCNFKKWGYEHVNYSDRIFMAGLTSFRYMDINGSEGMFYSDDEQHANINSTVKGIERKACIDNNKDYYKSKMYSYYFTPFIDKQNVILTCYFTSVTDPQRKAKWQANHEDLNALINSLKETKLIVFHDCFDEDDTENVMYIKVETNLNPYFQRWVTYREWLNSNKEWINGVFCIDATDVEVLREPFWGDLGDSLWTGDENEVVGCQWMSNHHPNPVIKEFIRTNKDRQLLNAGILGGEVRIVLEFMRQIIDFITFEDAGATDMGLFNYMAYTNWVDRIRTGRQVCTIFKANEQNNKIAFFKHK